MRRAAGVDVRRTTGRARRRKRAATAAVRDDRALGFGTRAQSGHRPRVWLPSRSNPEHQRIQVMKPCTRCHRHLREGATSCPFCKSRRVATAVTAIAIAAAVGTTACYGGPSKHDRVYSPPPDPSASTTEPASSPSK